MQVRSLPKALSGLATVIHVDGYQLRLVPTWPGSKIAEKEVADTPTGPSSSVQHFCFHMRVTEKKINHILVP